MIKYAVDKWNKNKELLEKEIKNDVAINMCGYDYIARLVIRYILNDGERNKDWDEDKITTIDNGEYQGTLLYLIPTMGYQPCESEYLMTWIGYGSCSVCDTLQSIQSDSLFNDEDDKLPNANQVKDYMTLCKDLIQHMICPYNTGWMHRSDFDNVEFDG